MGVEVYGFGSCVEGLGVWGWVKNFGLRVRVMSASLLLCRMHAHCQRQHRVSESTYLDLGGAPLKVGHSGDEHGYKSQNLLLWDL